MCKHVLLYVLSSFLSFSLFNKNEKITNDLISLWGRKVSIYALLLDCRGYKIEETDDMSTENSFILMERYKFLLSLHI